MAIKIWENRIFGLMTRKTSYIMAVGEEGCLENLYWGPRLDELEDFAEETITERGVKTRSVEMIPEECSSWGSLHFKETSLKVRFADGTDDFRPRVREVVQEGEHLEIVLEDTDYPFCVHLHYEVYEDADLIRKWRVLENTGGEPVELLRACSAEFGLPGRGYESIHYRGRWGEEFQGASEPVDTGKKVYESRCGLSSHLVNPSFIVHRRAAQTAGEVYFGVLEYSGNFKTVVEAVSEGFLNILTGVNDADFQWRLEGGETFETPAVTAGYVTGGFEEMSHVMHRFCREHQLPRALGNKTLPVLYNSWYSTHLDVRCEEQIMLARRAAKMGVELFVVDDGWFFGRKDETSGLGDWYADEEKFPEGLGELIGEVNRLGMKFGLWMEPEMVNPKSRLYRAHPDWVYHYEKREILMGRNQYILDLANPEVVAYLTDVFDRLLSENKIDYVKWDMNRYAAEMGSDCRAAERWGELPFRNTEGLYRLIGTLRERHPHVEFEACASGGGRVDYGVMRYFDEFWPSDNTDPLDRLYIQEQYSYLYPAKCMRAWLTDDFGMDRRKIPLAFSMHSAMCGALGIGTDLNRTSDGRLEEIAEYIRTYKEIRGTVQLGELYRLASFREGDLHAVQYVRGGESVVFAFLDHEKFGRVRYWLKLRGLRPDKKYRCTAAGLDTVKSGAYLMQAGLGLTMTGDYDSRLIRITEV